MGIVEFGCGVDGLALVPDGLIEPAVTLLRRDKLEGAVLALACLWALKAGWVTGKDQTRLKTQKHGRLAVSLFTRGRKFIVNKLYDLQAVSNLFKILTTPIQNRATIKQIQLLLT